MMSSAAEAITAYREPEQPVSRYYMNASRTLFVDLGKITEMWYTSYYKKYQARLEGLESITEWSDEDGRKVFDALCRYRGVQL